MRRALAIAFIALAACGPQEHPQRPPSQPALIIADSICAQIIGAAPPEAREEGWTIVTRDELNDADRTNWNTYHAVECPGLAEDDEWIGYGQPIFAVTSVQRQGDALMQKLVLLRPSDRGYTAQSVWGPREVEAAHTTFISSMPNQRATPPLQYPAFILERGDVFALAFFEAEGELRSSTIRE